VQQQTSTRPQTRVLVGVGLYLIGVLFQTLMEAAAKWLTTSYPVGQLVFGRALFALPLIFAFIAAEGGMRTLATKRPGMHVLSGLAMVSTISMTFAALRVLPLADAMAIFFAAPLFMTALAGLILRERIRRWNWVALLSGFLGVLAVLRPSGDINHPASLFAVGAAVTYALVVIATRSLTRTDSSNAILLYRTVVVAAIGGATCLFSWKTPTGLDLALLVFMGVAGAAGNYFMVRALFFAQVKSLALFDYTALVWALILGLLLWRQFPTPWVCAGATVIVAAGIIATRQERAEERPMGQAREGGVDS